MTKKYYPYRSIEDILQNFEPTESDHTSELLRLGKRCAQKKSITKKELYKFCHWKSSRSCHHINTNSITSIRKIVKASLAAKDDVLSVHILTALQGINVPTASAILMFLYPKKYCVIDTRVWQLLYDFKLVSLNPNGVAFSYEQWVEYLKIMRMYSKRFGLTVRQTEFKLFKLHQEKSGIKRILLSEI